MVADVLPSDELIDEPSDFGSLQPGHKLGRYELLVPIARGGMARVWAARLHGQRGFQKLVAIKTILPHLANEAEFERMFLDEARIASGVHHPNVCEIYELGEEKLTLYLAMEWVSGDSLARVLRASGKTEALDPRVVGRVVADACAGLHAAHELADDNGRSLGVVHRDLSPHNILLTADGTAKVADFGVAKAMGQLHEATSAGQLKGKIAYMAPEQVTGNQIDRRSDVFSLGCVLYEATTGQRPFRGDGDHQVMHAVLKGEYAAPSSFIRGYPQELERIVARALSQQPILRYPTAERMRFAIEEFLARGQLVTQSNVAQVVRQRIGEQLERRKERIRQASTAVERGAGWSEPPGGNMTPSNQVQDGQRSGVKPSAHGARPLFTTVAMERPEGLAQLGVPLSMAPLTPPMAPPMAPPTPPPLVPLAPALAHHPASSTTIPQAAQHPFAQTIQNPPGHVPGLDLPSAPQHQNYAQNHTPASYPGRSHSFPGAAHSPAPPPLTNALAQTSLMPPTRSPAPPPYTPSQPPQYPMLVQSQPPQQHNSAPISAPQPVPPAMPAAAFPNPIPTGNDRQGTPPAGTAQYLIAIGVGILVAVFIGVGGFVAWRGHRAPADTSTSGTTRGAPLVTAAAGSTTPSAETSGAAGPNGETAPGPSAATGGTVAPVSADIAFRVVPAEAMLSIEGKDLAPETRNVPRPAMGQTVNVVAHAAGYEDTTVLVDYFTTSPMELTLKAAAATGAPATTQGGAPKAGGASDPAAQTATATGEPAKDPPKKKQPAGGSALPANPY